MWSNYLYLSFIFEGLKNCKGKTSIYILCANSELQEQKIRDGCVKQTMLLHSLKMDIQYVDIYCYTDFLLSIMGKSHKGEGDFVINISRHGETFYHHIHVLYIYFTEAIINALVRGKITRKFRGNYPGEGTRIMTNNFTPSLPCKKNKFRSLKVFKNG